MGDSKTHLAMHDIIGPISELADNLNVNEKLCRYILP